MNDTIHPVYRPASIFQLILINVAILIKLLLFEHCCAYTLPQGGCVVKIAKYHWNLQSAPYGAKLLTHYQMTILDSSKLKELADDNFKVDENGRKLSKQVENTVGKGEIARY